MIRAWREEDHERIVDLVHHSRLRAYGDLMGPDGLDRDAAERTLARWRRRVDDPEQPGEGFVDEEGGLLAGVCAIGAEAHGRSGDRVGELVALYVEPAAQGAGVGGRLLRHAERELRASGCTEAVLWVYEANEPARAFYRSAGWQEEPREAWRDAADQSQWDAPGVRMRRTL